MFFVKVYPRRRSQMRIRKDLILVYQAKRIPSEYGCERLSHRWSLAEWRTFLSINRQFFGIGRFCASTFRPLVERDDMISFIHRRRLDTRGCNWIGIRQ